MWLRCCSNRRVFVWFSRTLLFIAIHYLVWSNEIALSRCLALKMASAISGFSLMFHFHSTILFYSFLFIFFLFFYPLRRFRGFLWMCFSNFVVSVECVSLCNFSKGNGSGRHDCSVFSCAWKAPRALTGSLASTAHSSQYSSWASGPTARRIQLQSVSIVSFAGNTTSWCIRRWYWILFIPLTLYKSPLSLVVSGSLIRIHLFFFVIREFMCYDVRNLFFSVVNNWFERFLNEVQSFPH